MKTGANYTKMQEELEAMTRRGNEMRKLLKDGRIYELVASGDRVAVRPVMIEQPRQGERDLWFNLSYNDWRKFREEGFDGWMKTNEESGQPKVMILVDKATLWLEERCRKQAEKREDGSGPRRMHWKNKKHPQPEPV